MYAVLKYGAIIHKVLIFVDNNLTLGDEVVRFRKPKIIYIKTML